ncbi:IS481 family transposase [Nesterenkonia aerolata]|uniref:IS481 family transposase n=1 Tax=Nesterenkonia aerolata TaxID=3074079 RepID=A0ABU2DVH4_9MICC|nr:IS481 family transposase [Nesterenkonia sp. LY-0111]MDR8020509.1 IS481 family transposase [Nesterenkonia sp. LY-0111]
MTATSKNRAIVLAITEGTLTVTEASIRFNVSRRWIYTLLNRHRTDGLDALTPRSRRPHTNPNATDPTTIDTILELRETLTRTGLDAGAESIWDRLPPPRPSPTTIWRILNRHGIITAQPQKRPRSSWHRFQADQPNETWQSDFTHWPLTDGTDTEIISWLDDHSRCLLHTSAHHRVTGRIVIDTFTDTMDTHGPPASTLTDNGMVYTTRFANGHDGTPAQPNGFEQLLADLGITQKNGAANHPTTQGKIERYHQTLKRWLTADGLVGTLPELDEQLARFRHIYNTERPHRAIGRRTPETAYTATEKAFPVLEAGDRTWRVRYDRIGPTGTITVRYAGRLRHLGIGRAWAKRRVILLAHGPHTMIIDRNAGEIIAEHTIDPTKNYQKKT